MLTSFHLPPHEALALFYHVSLVLALLTVGILIYGYLRSRKHPLPTSYNPGDRTQRSRHWLLYGLGILWLLDGILQAQPYMVTRFIGGFLAPLIAGQPAPAAWLVHMGLDLWKVNPPVFNVVATFTQIGIGLGLLFARKRGQRVALTVSLLWGSTVWIAGEGFGGIFVGGAWFTGAPGSVLLYMASAVLLLLPEEFWGSERMVAWTKWGLVAVFAMNALLEALPSAGWWGPELPGFVMAMGQMPQPTIFSAPLYAVGDVLNYAPWLWNGLLVAGLILAAATFAFWSKNRALIWFSAIWVFLGWWLGQDFGILGGMGTDPNTGAILLLGVFVYADRLGLVTLPHLSRRESMTFHSEHVSQRS